MAVLTPGVPVVSDSPLLEVEGLAPGTHRFRLVVEDDAGNTSLPDERELTVVRSAPQISGMRPGFGDWGDEVAIIGRGFDAEPRKNQVAFSAGVAAAVVSGSSTELRVQVPQPAVSGPVVLVNGAGNATSPRPFFVPRSFVVEPAAAPVFDLATEALRDEVWVLHGQRSGSDLGAVSMLSLATRELLGSIVVQAGAREIAIAEGDLALAAVSNSNASSVSVIDVRERKLIAQVRVAPGPAGLAFQPGGRVIYVACAGRAASGGAAGGVLDVIELGAAAAPRVVARIELAAGPARVVFAPDGKFAFVNEAGNGSVAMIDATAHRLVRRFDVGGAPTSAPSEVAVSAQTFPLLVATPGTRNASLVAADGSVRLLDTGAAMTAAAIDRDFGWLSGPDEALVLAVDLGRSRLRKVQAAGPGAGPTSLVVAPRAGGLLVPSPTADAAAVILAGAAPAMQCIVRLPKGPLRGVLGAGGRFACFLCATDALVGVVVVDSVLG